MAINNKRLLHKKPTSNVMITNPVRDRFVDGLLLGMDTKNAAFYAGIKGGPKLAEYARKLKNDLYVQERLTMLREAMDESKLVTRKEMLLNLKAIAHNEDEQTKDRIAATMAIAKIAGFEAPTKTANLHLIQGGVMLVPVPQNADDWETAAKEAQSRLKEDVRK